MLFINAVHHSLCGVAHQKCYSPRVIRCLGKHILPIAGYAVQKIW